MKASALSTDWIILIFVLVLFFLGSYFVSFVNYVAPSQAEFLTGIYVYILIGGLPAWWFTRQARLRREAKTCPRCGVVGSYVTIDEDFDVRGAVSDLHHYDGFSQYQHTVYGNLTIHKRCNSCGYTKTIKTVGER